MTHMRREKRDHIARECVFAFGASNLSHRMRNIRIRHYLHKFLLLTGIDFNHKGYFPQESRQKTGALVIFIPTEKSLSSP
jgi:hypothetical protein